MFSDRRDQNLVFTKFADRGKVSATGGTEGKLTATGEIKLVAAVETLVATVEKLVSAWCRKISRGGRKISRSMVEQLVATGATKKINRD